MGTVTALSPTEWLSEQTAMLAGDPDWHFLRATLGQARLETDLDGLAERYPALPAVATAQLLVKMLGMALVMIDEERGTKQ